MSTNWQSVSKREPCPACGGVDRCARQGELLHCFRSKNAPAEMRFVRNSVSDSRGAIFAPWRRSEPTSGPRPHPTAGEVLDLANEHERFRGQLSTQHRDELAQALGVTPESLELLEVGWATSEDLRRLGASGAGWSSDRPDGAFSFPEFDGARTLVGFSLRALDGRKGSPASKVGTRRGLIVPDDGDAIPGPVLIVEGASDVAAALSLGLRAVGRPNNGGGAKDLAELLAGEREVVVVAENDRKANGSWPGRDGAMHVACKLATAWGRAVPWRLPPADSKDLRAWLRARVAKGLDIADTAAARTAGAEFLHALDGSGADEDAPAVARGVPAWRPFPTHALPEPLAANVRNLARALCVDEAMVAVPKLGVLAGEIGNARRLQLAAEYCVPSVLWTAVLAPSGERKSPMLDAASRTLADIDREIAHASAGRWEDYRCELANWRTLKASDRKRAAPPTPPPQLQKRVDDATGEALLWALNDNPQGLVHVSDELAGTLLGLNQYKQNGRGNDAQRYLRMYDAGAVHYDRAQRTTTGERLSILIPRAALSIAGAAQPGVFWRALGQEGRENGMAARFIVTRPPLVRATWADIENARPPSDSLAEIERKLAALDMPNGEARTLSLTESGRRRWTEFFNAFQSVKREAPSEALRAHYAKLEAACARIALVFHLVRALRDPASVEDVERVDGDSIDRAAAVIGWAAPEAERVYGQCEASKEDSAMRELADWIRERGGIATARDLYRNLSRYRTVGDAQRALDELAAAGFGLWRARASSERGGAPTREFVLHGPRSGEPVSTDAIASDGTDDEGSVGVGAARDDGTAGETLDERAGPREFDRGGARDGALRAASAELFSEARADRFTEH